MKAIWLSLIPVFLLGACQPQPAPTLSITAIHPAEETPVPTRVQTEVSIATIPLTTSTLAPNPTPSPTPTRLPGEPLFLPGTPIPLSQIPISLDNLEQVDLLARWGTGIPEKLGFSADGSLLGVETSSARYLFETSNFTQVPIDLSILEEIFSEPGPSYEISYDNCTTTPCDQADVLRDGEKVGQMRVSGTFAVSQDGSLAAGELFNGQIIELWIYDLTTGEPLISIDTSAKDADGQPIPCFHKVNYIEFSPDKNSLVAACQGGAAYLFRVSDGALLQTFRPAEGQIGGISFSPDSTLLISESEGMLVWRVADGELLFDLTETHNIPGAYIYGKDFSPDGKYLAVAQSNGIVQVYDMTNGSLAHVLLEGTPDGGTLDLSPDGDMLATVAGGLVQLRSVVDGSLLSSAQIPGYPFEINHIRFSPDGRVLALSGKTGVDIWTVPDEPEAELPYQGWIKVTPHPYDMAFHPDGDKLLVLSEIGIQSFNLENLASAGTIELPAELWDTTVSRDGEEVTVEIAGVWDIDVSPDGGAVAVALPGELRVLSYPNGKTLFSEGLDGQVERVLFSPDGSALLVSVSNLDFTDTNYILYSTRDWSVLKRVPETIALGTFQVFSPDSQILVTRADERIVLRRAEDAMGLVEMEAHAGFLMDLVFSQDGTLMASIGSNGTISIWGIP